MERPLEALVPNRECGTCSVCCKQLTVNTPELRKLPGVLCQHCTSGTGCQIYETRPSVCRAWYCGWRVLPQLDESWRPDRSEILISQDQDGRSAGYSQPALKIELIGSLEKIRWMPLVNFIATAVDSKIPIFLAVPGPPGHAVAIAFLNENLEAAVKSRRLDRMLADLNKAVRACEKHPKEAIHLDAK